MADEIKVQITADASGFESGAKQATDAVDGLNDKLGTIKDAAKSGSDGLNAFGENARDAVRELARGIEGAEGFGTALKHIAEIASGVFGGMELRDFATTFKDFASEAIFGSTELGEKLTNVSEATGISTSKLQEFRFAAQITGNDFDILQRSVSELSLKMLELRSGSKDAALTSAISDMGLTPGQLADSATALDSLSAAVIRMGSSERTIGDLSEILGGRGGARLMPILTQLGELTEKYHELGLELDPGQVDALNKAAESTHLLGAEWEHFENVLVAGAAPALSTIATDLLPALGKAAEDALPYLERLAPYLLPGGIGSGIDQLLGMKGLTSTKSVGEAGTEQPAGTFGSTKGAGEYAPLNPEETPAPPDSKEQQESALEAFIQSQRLMVAQSADTTAARVTEEQNIHDYIVTNEHDLASVGIDVNKQLMESAIGLADARKAAERESANEYIKSEKEKEIGAALNASAQAHDEQHVAEFGDIGDAGLRAHLTQRWEEDQAKRAELIAQSKTDAAQIASVLEPIASAFDDSIKGVIMGTQTVTEAFRKMGESILLEFAKGGLHSLIGGASANSAWSSIFGVSGEGGGIAGMAGNALTGGGAVGGAGTSNASGGILAWLLGPAESSAVMSSIKSITGGSGGLFGWLFGTAGTAIMSAFGGASSAAGSKPAAPTGGVAGGAASVAGSAVGGASQSLGVVNEITKLGTTLKVPLQTMVTHLATMGSTAMRSLEQDAEGLAADALYYAVSLVDFAIMVAHDASGIIGNIFGLSGGGIIPSAAGGMIVGGAGFGAFPAILHQNEMVLPEPISRTIQNMTRDGAADGGDIHTHFHIAAMDGKSVSDFFDRHGDDIARSIQRGVRNQNPKMHAAIKMGSR